MYKYPYGDSQQLNLDWIIAKLKELEASGGSGGGADLEEVSNALISLTYNTSTAYRRYDYAFLNGKLYRCLTDTSGAFDPAAWMEVRIGEDIPVLTRLINADVTALNTKMPDDYVSDLNILGAGYPLIVWYAGANTLNNPTPSRNGMCFHLATSANYAVQIAAAVGAEDIYIRKKSGGTWGSWKIYGNTTEQINHKITSWDPATNGKIVFLSNSYGNLSSQNWEKFPYWCATYLGLGTEGVNWWNAAEPYFSLAHETATRTFLYELQTWVASHPNEVQNVGAVVVVGGINDSRPQESGESYARYTKIAEKMQELITYIKTNLPNATAYCGYTGWIDLIARPTDNRRGPYRLKVAQAYMEATQFGWKYLNGVENIIHNKNYLSDGIHPNEAGAKRLGMAVAEALITGSCEIIEASTTQPTPITGGSIGNSSKARERQQNGVINTQFNAFQFSFPSNETITASSSHSLVVGNIDLKMSTGVVEFGNQIISFGQYVPASGDDPAYWIEHPCYARIYIADNGDVTIQCKAFCDGQASYTVRRVTSFTISESHAVYADDTWNNMINF